MKIDSKLTEPAALLNFRGFFSLLHQLLPPGPHPAVPNTVPLPSWHGVQRLRPRWGNAQSPACWMELKAADQAPLGCDVDPLKSYFQLKWSLILKAELTWVASGDHLPWEINPGKRREKSRKIITERDSLGREINLKTCSDGKRSTQENSVVASPECWSSPCPPSAASQAPNL